MPVTAGSGAQGVPGTGRTFQQALQSHQSGDLPQAEQLYRRILRIDPYHADALHLMGVLAHQQGRHENAVKLIGDALRVNARNPIYLGNLGAAYRALGRLDDAAETCQQALQLDPKYAGAHFNLGLILLSQGNALGAQRRFEQALKIQPDMAEAWNSLGNACEALHQHDRAISAYQEALKRNPEHAETQYNYGNACLANGRPHEALAAYSAALAIRPQFPDALNNLGTVLRSLGQYEPAIASFRLAIQFHPEFSEAHNNLGTTYASLSRYEEAEESYHAALRIQPTNAVAHNNLGSALNARGLAEEAIVAFQEATRLNPGDPETWSNLGVALQTCGRVHEAGEAYQAGLKRLPEHGRMRIQRGTILPPIYDSLDDLNGWRARFAEHLGSLAADRVTLDARQDPLPVNFYLPYQGQNDRELQTAAAAVYHRPELLELPTGRCPKLPGGRKRIGVISHYFKNHTIGNLSLGLIAKLPRRDFEVIVISVGSPQDALAGAIRQAADQYIALPQQIALARQQVAQLGLDVLFYTDLGMDPITWTLAHSRLAPVQCVTWGHPVTTGLPTLDFFVSSDLIEPPQARTHYSEKLIELSSLPAYYYRPELRTEVKPQEAYGIPADAHLYLCPQSLFKFHPDFDPLLLGILRRDPRARIAVIEAPYRHWTEKLQQRLRRTLGAEFNRVQFLPRQGHQDFLNLMAISAVMLDPMHFGGGNTTYQGVAAGVPIVTLPGEFMRGRVTYGCYQKMGVLDTVASSAAQYVDLAVRLATDADYNADVRSRLTAASPRLYEDHSAVVELTAFFHAATSGRV